MNSHPSDHISVSCVSCHRVRINRDFRTWRLLYMDTQLQLQRSSISSRREIKDSAGTRLFRTEFILSMEHTKNPLRGRISPTSASIVSYESAGRHRIISQDPPKKEALNLWWV